VSLRTAIEELPHRGERAAALLGEPALEAARRLIGVRAPHGTVEFRDVRTSVRKHELQCGENVVPCSQRVGHRRPTLPSIP
jgi:hypothetical protein